MTTIVRNSPQLHILRRILRKIRTSTLTNTNTKTTGGALEQQILVQYRASQNEINAPRTQALGGLAYEFHMLGSDLSSLDVLRDLDGGAESKLSPREMSRRAAARAGLQLPEPVTL